MSVASDLVRMAIHDSQSLFGRKIEKLRLRSRAYRLSFRSLHGQQVLHDLAEFCRANESCFHADPRLHAVLEGRREVWLRINQLLNLTPEEQLLIFDKKYFQALPQEEKD